MRARLFCKIIYYVFGLCGIGVISYLWCTDIIRYNYSLLYVMLLIIIGKTFKII